MDCNYYITTSIVIEYMSTDDRYCTITTDTIREKRYLVIPTKYYTNAIDVPNKINDFIGDTLLHNTYKETIFANSLWTTEEYKTRFSMKYIHIFPHIKKIMKIFKSVHASKYI